MEESRIRYEAGDHVAIYPTNDLQLVNKIGQLLDIDLDTVFTMKALDEDATKKSPFPVPTTYRTALKHYVRAHHMFSPILNFLFKISSEQQASMLDFTTFNLNSKQLFDSSN